MNFSGYEPKIGKDHLERLLREMTQSRIAALPRPLRGAARDVFLATSSDMLEQRLNDLIALGIDWSRAGPTTPNWGSNYCACALCGRQVANKEGVVDHMRYLHCPLVESIAATARSDHSTTRSFKKKRAKERRAEEARAKALCVVDIGHGQEQIELRSGQRSDMTAIEPRLQELGFTKTVKKLSGGETETRWEMTTAKAYVLADPRREGRIDIRAWPHGTQPRQARGFKYIRHGEYILDSWRRDLAKKVEVRIEKMLGA